MILIYVGVVKFLVEGKLFDQFNIAKDLEYASDRWIILKGRKRLGLSVAGKAKRSDEA